MQKISKSKTPKYSLVSKDQEHLELEPMEGNFLLSVKDEGDETWKCVELSLEQLENMLKFARMNT